MGLFYNSNLLHHSFRPLLVALLLMLGVVFPNILSASHGAGYDLRYVWLSGNRIQITASAYRDCGGITFANDVNLTITSSCGNNIVVQLPQVRIVPIQCFCNAIQAPGTNNGTNCDPNNPTTRTCFEVVEFESIIQLPANVTSRCDITMFTSDCCRNGNVLNLDNPGSRGFYSEAIYNGVRLTSAFGYNPTMNQSPIFGALPIPTICVGQPFTFNQSASDPDGDLLEYTLIAARELTGGVPTTIPYVAPFTPTDPLPVSATAPFTSCGPTGQIAFTPTTPGSYTVVLRVDEYRRDPSDPTGFALILVGSSMRDMQIQVNACAGATPSQPAYFVGVDYTVRGNFTPATTTLCSDASAVCPGLPNTFQGSTCNICSGEELQYLIIARDPDGVAGLTGYDFTCNVSDVYGPSAGYQVFSSPEDPLEIWCLVTIPNVTVSGAFFVRLTDNVCPVSSNQSIGFTINVNGVAIQAGDDIRLCARVGNLQDYTLTAVARTSALSGNFTWTQVSGPTVPFTVGTIRNTSNCSITFPQNMLETDPVEFEVTYNDGFCISSDRVTINFDNYVTTITGPATACAGVPTLWEGSTSLNGVVINDPNRYTTTTVTNPCALLPTPGATIVTTLVDDNFTTAIPIGFPFTFYGNTFNSVFIAANAFITFGAGAGSLANGTLPSPTSPFNLISLAWDDWIPQNGGTVSYATVGTAPNRQFIVTYDGIPRFGNTTTLTGQIILFEGTNVFQTNIISMTSPNDVTIGGHNNSNGTAGGGVLLPANTTLNCPPSIVITPFNTSFIWGIDGATPGGTPSSTLTTALSAGVHTITACLADGSLTNGCITCHSTLVTVASALTAPTLANCTPGIGQVVFEVAATDINSTGFQWRPCGSTGSWTTLAAGTNTVTVTGLTSSAVGCIEVRSTGSNGVLCPNVSAQVTCTSLPCYNVTVNQTNPNCFGATNGSVSIDVTGFAAPGLTVTRAGGPAVTSATSPLTITGLSAGVYNFTLTDGIGCPYPFIVTITSPATLAVSVNSAIATCGTNGTLSSTVTGGTPGYTYSWTGSTGCNFTTASTNAACPGNYVLTVTDANGCTLNSNAVNVGGINTVLTVVPTSPRVCGGITSGRTQSYAATVTGTTTGTYLWSQVSGVASTIGGGSTSAITASLPSNLTTATAPVFVVSYTHSGTCNVTATVTVDVDYQQLSATVSDATACAGQTITLGANLSNPRPNIVQSTTSYTVSSITYAPETPTAAINCTLTGGTLDNGHSRVVLGFPFSFYGVTYTDVFVGTNGYLAFQTGRNQTHSGTIPNNTQPSRAVYLVGGDLQATANSMQYEILGTAPNRRFVLYYSNSDVLAGVPQIGQIVLYEGSNDIDIISQNINYGASATQGIELNNSSALAVPGRNNTVFTAIGSSYRFSYASTLLFPSPTYTWATSTGTPVGNTQNVTTTQNSATTYVVTAVYAGSCPYTATVTVNMGNTITAPAVTCGNRTANSAEFLASTPVGATGMEYSLDNGLSWNNYTGSFVNGGMTPGQCATLLARGTSSNVDDCVFTVSAPAVCCAVNCFPFTVSTTPTSCFGSSDGGITVTPTGVTTTVTYQLVDRVTSTVVANSADGAFTGLAANSNYIVSLTDINGCVDVANVTVTQPSAISLTTSSSIATCDCDASAGVTATGGTGSYTYVWSNAGSTQTITGLCSGDSFEVTVTDTNGCTAASSAVTITGGQPNLVSLTSPEVCLGASTILTASWINGGINACTTVTNGCSTSDASLPFGNYSNLLNLTATDGNPLRRDVNDSRIQMLFTAGDLRYMGVGTHKLTNLGFNVSRKQSTTPTNWTIKLTCVAPTVTQVGSTWINTAAGSTVFSGNVTTTAGYNFLPFNNHYVWDGTSNLVVEICADNNATNLTDELEGSVLTQQRVLFATSNTSLGCISNSVVPTATFQTPIFNFGMCMDNATYTWQAPNGTISAPQASPLFSITPTQSGNYIVTARVNGCQRVTTTFVTVNTPIAAPAIACGNATSNSLEFTWNTPAGATSFEYSTSGAGPWTATTSTSFTLTGLTPLTNHTLFVRAANVPLGCTNLIGQQTCTTTNCTAVTTTFAATRCFGAADGTITATALTPGNFTFALFNSTGVQVGATLSASPATFTGVAAGAYQVRFTDLTNVCSATYPVTVTQPTQLVATSSKTDETCYLALNGTATVAASNGTAPYAITWSTNVDVAQRNSFIVTGLTGDTYDAVVSDANGCTVATGVTVNGPTQPIDVTFTAPPTQPTCLGATNGSASVSVTGAQGTVNYVWTPANANARNISNVVQGPLSVIVTDANGCSNTVATTVSTPPTMSAGITTTPACSGLSNASAAASPLNYTGPPVTYTWNVPGNTASLNNLAPNTNLAVTINNGIGCTASNTANTGAAIQYTASVTSVQAPSCNTGASDGILTASFITSGATVASYLWGNASTAVQRTGLTPGQNETVTLTASNGCVATATGAALAAIQNFSVVTVTTTSPTCPGSTDGSAVVTTTFTGNPLLLTYTWTGNPSNTRNANNYAVGAVAAVTVGAPFGCVATGIATVTYDYNDIAPYGATATPTPPSCSYSADGSASVSITVSRAGAGPYAYSYVWTPGNSTQPGINSLAGGTSVSVRVNIIGIAGCEVVATTVVPTTSALTVTTSPVSALPCSDNQRLAVLNASASGGTGAINYVWSTGASATNATGLTAGTYTVTATDQLNCTATSSYPLISILTPTADIHYNGSATSAVSSASPGIDFSVPMTASSGQQVSTTYTWSSDNSEGILTNTNGFNVEAYGTNAAGIITVTYSVTASNTGCTATDAIVIQYTLASIQFANIFTPNNDRLNDVFGPIIAGAQIQLVSFSVYNRWGAIVYQSTDRANTLWDGRFQGDDCPNDMYIYQLRYREAGSTVETVRTGEVNLIR